MKVIDVLNKIANGEIDRNNEYQFSRDDYCTVNDFFARYIVDEENLNLEIIEEDKKIKKLDLDWTEVLNFKEQAQQDCVKMVFNKINEIIDKINEENSNANN